MKTIVYELDEPSTSMARPRIIMFSKLFWPEGGGAELATYLVVKDIISRYFEVTIVSGTKDHAVLNGCRYVYWPLLRERFKPLEWLKLFLGMGSLRKLVERAEVVYIPSHTLLPLAIVAKHIKKGVKVVLHLHNYQPLSYTSVYIKGLKPTPATEFLVEYLENSGLARALLTGLISHANILSRLSLYYADAIICVSRAQLETISKFIKGVREKSHVVYNPLLPDLNVEKNPSKKPILIYAGGGSYGKGSHILLKVLSQTLKKDVKKVYIIAGRRLFERDLRVLNKLEKLYSGKLAVLGRLEYKQYLQLHTRTWALLFPSIWEEPLPYTVVESMALRTIPVASRVGGVPEIVEGTPAQDYMFKPGNIEEFMNRIERVASLTRGELIDIGAKVREHTIRKFDVSRISKELVKIFYKI